MGAKWMEIRCRNCGDETRADSIVKKYQGRAKTPFYTYSALILFAGLATFWFYWNKNNQKNKIEYIAHPAIGDVYNISKDENYTTTHYFMRIVALREDSVMLLQSHLEYTGFITDLADDDYFVKDDTSAYSRKQLQQMLDNNEIYAVKRNYGSGGGFNRIK
jgi:phosphoglycerate-specific signal transduction histidine kinase